MAAARKLLEAGVPPDSIITVPEEKTFVQVRGKIIFSTNLFI
jgi:hypothetical protein